ncbi:S8 family serine peptidase [Herbaspirillum sp. ST 5-3]|uniref:S8 family serine peptidase n=1 Tax=Oxalobacteraceae TaxID=75682 RepID=UPI0010A40495|nr:S8 family serine peptidase [Herbaspirillum sp. ST 5-3]
MRHAPSSHTADLGSYVWRGGKKIELEKETDRFTVIPSSPQQLEKLRTAPGVHEINPLTNEVFKVETTMTERDSAMDAVRSEAFKSIAHHAYRPKDSEGTVYYLTDRIIVSFAANATHEQVDKLLEKYGLRVLKEYGGQQHTFLLQVTTEAGENPIKLANRLAEEKIVTSAEPNMVNRFMPAFIPSDGLFPRQWHLNASNGVQLVAEASVHAPEAWDVTRGERSIVVALIDDGFDLSHPDFDGAGKIVSPKDYVDGDANPFPEAEHDDYHGTPCAGVAIAESNGRGVVGVAHGCAFMPVRFPLAADDDLLIEIFNEVGQKADVISCSWGPPPVFAPLASAVDNALTQLAMHGGPRGKGCVICFAAANFDAPVKDLSNAGGFLWLDYGSGALRRTTGPILNGFAAHPKVVAVAASTSMNRHAAYSNWGREISVCAPSNNFHPRDTRKFVPGRGIWTTDNEAFGSGFTAHSRFTGRFGGTSSATPLVAGVAALVLSANSRLSADEVKDILQSTADKIADTDSDIVLGGNRGQYDGNGHCDWFGHGKVNAAKAVVEARKRGTS